MSENQFVNADDVAVKFRVKKERIYHWVRAGVLPAGCFVRLGPKKLMFNLQAISSWAASGGSVETNEKQAA